MADWATQNMGATFSEVIEEGKQRAQNYREPSLIRSAFCILSDVQEELERLSAIDESRVERIRQMINKAKFWMDNAKVIDKELKID